MREIKAYRCTFTPVYVGFVEDGDMTMATKTTQVATPAWLVTVLAERAATTRDVQYVTKALGPRRVGGRYRSSYWGTAYEVLAVNITREHGALCWWVTERDIEGPDAGRIRTHATSWDRRDKIIFQPEGFSAEA